MFELKKIKCLHACRHKTVQYKSCTSKVYHINIEGLGIEATNLQTDFEAMCALRVIYRSHRQKYSDNQLFGAIGIPANVSLLSGGPEYPTSDARRHELQDQQLQAAWENV